MEHLPDELLLHILFHLPRPVLLCSARRVSRRWHSLSYDASLWTTIDLSVFRCGPVYDSPDNKSLVSAGVRRLLEEAQGEVEQIIFGDAVLDEDVYELFGCRVLCESNILVRFPCLQILDFSYSKITGRNLQKALTANPWIEELNLSHTGVPLNIVLKEVIELEKLKRLVYHDLSIEWDFVLSRHFDEQTQSKLLLMNIPKHCTLLEKIEIHTVWCFLDDEIIQQFVLHCPYLNHVSFNWSSQITEEAFKFSNPSSPGLKKLVLSDRQAKGPYLNGLLPYFPTLQELTISGHNVHIDDCRAIANFCPNLRQLTLQRGTLQSGGHMFDVLERGSSLCGAELNIISKKCSQLRKIQAPCSDIDDLSVSMLTEHCPHLEAVNFSQCLRLTVTSIRALAKNSACLRSINLFEVGSISCNDLLVLFTNCPRLEEAILDYREHDRSSWKTLEVLEETFSESGQSVTSTEAEESFRSTDVNVPNEDIPMIDMKSSLEDNDYYDLLDGLQEQELANSNKGSENFLMSPILCPNPVKAVHCNLRKLSLKNCTCPAKSLQALFSDCPDLTEVYLDGSSSLTDDTIITLVRSCPCIKTLSIPCRRDLLHMPTYGDRSLLEIAKYSSQIESLNMLFNRNITSVGLTALFIALETSLNNLCSLSVCVGRGYQCSIQTVVAHGLKFLTKKSKNYLKSAVSSKTVDKSFMVLHLDYKLQKH